MPHFKVKNVKSTGIEVQNISAEALTIKEHGGENWQTSPPAHGEKVSRRIQPPSSPTSAKLD